MSFSSATLLIISDEKTLPRLLKQRFTTVGYQVLVASDGSSALEIINQEFPNLVIIDILLSKQDGFEVCRFIRKASSIPIILISSLTNVSDRIIGLELGADDYITKPFSPQELEARIRSVLRRTTAQKNNLTYNKQQFYFGTLFIDLNTKQIQKNNVNIKLTGIEFNLLQLLITNAGKNLSRIDILNNVWGYTPERLIDLRVVDVHISRLRRKLEDNPKTPELILTIRGAGYRFQQY